MLIGHLLLSIHYIKCWRNTSEWRRLHSSPQKTLRLHLWREWGLWWGRQGASQHKKLLSKSLEGAGVTHIRRRKGVCKKSGNNPSKTFKTLDYWAEGGLKWDLMVNWDQRLQCLVNHVKDFMNNLRAVRNIDRFSVAGLLWWNLFWGMTFLGKSLVKWVWGRLKWQVCWPDLGRWPLSPRETRSKQRRWLSWLFGRSLLWDAQDRGGSYLLRSRAQNRDLNSK